jgi:hypothetical protein
MRDCFTLRLEPLSREAGVEMLHDLTHPEISPAFDDKEQDQILAACGGGAGAGAGVSPLALAIVAGMLRQKAKNPLGFNRQKYLNKLVQEITSATSKVQKVMRVTFEYLPDDLRSDFLKLHLFPDMFSAEDAGTLLNKDWDDVLPALGEYNLLTKRDGEYLILDHIWFFATSEAEDVDSEWLKRKDYADAVMRLIKMVSARYTSDHSNPSALPRLYHAAVFHADNVQRLMERKRPLDGEPGPSSPVAFRSLDPEAAPGYGERGQALGASPVKKVYCLRAKDVTGDLEAAVQELVRTHESLVRDHGDVRSWEPKSVMQ